MSPYVRLLIMFILAKLKFPVSIHDDYISEHRGLPKDLDLYMHMNNGCYFTITDIVRIETPKRAGI